MRTLTLTLAVLVALPAVADDDAKKAATPFHHWGKLQPDRKSGKLKLSYLDTSGKKPKKATALISINKATAFYGDQRIPLSSLKKDESLWVLGEAKEQTTRTPEGRTSTDRQIVNTLMVLAGEGIGPAKDLPLPKKLTWLEVTVARPGAALSVHYDGQLYRVICARSFAALKRVKLSKQPRLKKTLYGEVVAHQTEDGLVARRVTILDKRLKRQLPLFLGR